MAKVVCLTSVHSPHDPRINRKQCQTLAKAGHDVTIVAPVDQYEGAGRVRIRPVPKARSRFERMTLTVWAVARAALAEDADVYHFHDPELIPVGLFLRLRGKPVIYDVHEDYVTAVSQRRYIPRLIRAGFGKLVGLLESFCAPFFTVVLAERYYRDRFPDGICVLNYPVPIELRGRDLTPERDLFQFLYTGSVSMDRGALNHARMLRLRDDIEVYVIGRCDGETANAMRGAAGDAVDRLHIIGEGRYVPFEEIAAAYARGQWTAGLALFPLTPHYEKKELTKFFEYMNAGIPVLSSDFPVWRELIEENGVGLCVDPEDEHELHGALDFLVRNADVRAQMGSRGRRAVEQRYNWGEEGKRLVALYDRLLTKHSSTGR